jgi:hypothetical protein
VGRGKEHQGFSFEFKYRIKSEALFDTAALRVLASGSH